MLDSIWLAILFVILGFIAAGVIAKLIFALLRLKRITIYEYQKGLKYTRGRYAGTLDSGQYWLLGWWSSVVLVDIRPQFVSVPGQEVLSADGVSVKISVAAEFKVADPHAAINKNLSFQNSLYLTLQMAVREVVSKEKVDALIETRSSFSAKLKEMTAVKAAEYGVNLISVDIKDIMFAGEMKRAFAQVLKAQKEGQAALEKARGETAALRSLANAARMIDDNPHLLQLRALQTLAETSGNTLFFGVPNGSVPLPSRSPKSSRAQKQSGEEE
ncbi:MAG TPA: slipin family protein [Candidatus Acidoferrales bacterium]|nr:slipin family protein [Candidatus Acidoferrales bacterium]